MHRFVNDGCHNHPVLQVDHQASLTTYPKQHAESNYMNRPILTAISCALAAFFRAPPQCTPSCDDGRLLVVLCSLVSCHSLETRTQPAAEQQNSACDLTFVTQLQEHLASATMSAGMGGS